MPPVDQWTKVGATTGGKPSRNVFVRDVNGMLWELIQRAAQ
ncbi:MAG: hypothetical protein ABI824_07485 [Acidobacteriota bacterium]